MKDNIVSFEKAALPQAIVIRCEGALFDYSATPSSDPCFNQTVFDFAVRMKREGYPVRLVSDNPQEYEPQIQSRCETALKDADFFGKKPVSYADRNQGAWIVIDRDSELRQWTGRMKWTPADPMVQSFMEAVLARPLSMPQAVSAPSAPAQRGPFVPKIV